MGLELNQKIRNLWKTFSIATDKFWNIDGEHRAAAFAYYALFSLLPLAALFISLGSFFVDRNTAANTVVEYFSDYSPMSLETKNFILTTINGVIYTRGQIGIVAFVVLAWSSLQLFSSLIHAVNRAWDIESHNWWQLPLKSFVLVSILLGIALCAMMTSVIVKLVRDSFFSSVPMFLTFYDSLLFCVQPIVMFGSITMFYKVSPRRLTKFSEVWMAALTATISLHLLEGVFGIYLKNATSLNALYGTLAGIMAVLIWIYLSGCVLIFGACLCAAHSIPISTNAKSGVRVGK